MGFTQRYGPTTLVAGGTVSDSLLSCDSADVMISHGSTIRFFGRRGINYNGQVYNDPVPDSGTVSITV